MSIALASFIGLDGGDLGNCGSRSGIEKHGIIRLRHGLMKFNCHRAVNEVNIHRTIRREPFTTSGSPQKLY